MVLEGKLIVLQFEQPKPSRIKKVYGLKDPWVWLRRNVITFNSNRLQIEQAAKQFKFKTL